MSGIDQAQYKCPQCGAPLRFDPTLGKLVCDFCEGTFTKEEVEFEASKQSGTDLDKDGMEKEGSEKNASVKDAVEKSTNNDDERHFEDVDRDKLDNMRVYQCVSCGATIETDYATAATKCPYCDNNVILMDKLSGGYKPDYIIPFKIKSDELPAAVKRFYKNKKLLPKDFFSKNQLEGTMGIYVPFWLFDVRAKGNMKFNATLSASHREGDYEVIETSHYLVEREGTMKFEKIPVDASVKMDNDIMDSIEPFDYKELVDFDSAYLSGFLADRYDDSTDKCMKRADVRFRNSTKDQLTSTVTGYEAVHTTSSHIEASDKKVSYVLLPVYVFSCKYKDKVYKYAMNGQTGKVVGELPISTGKILTYLAAVTLGVAAVLVPLIRSFLYF